MTMTDITEEPLFSPQGDFGAKAELVANIGGELSLWNMNDAPGGLSLRVYPEDGYGFWLNTWAYRGIHRAAHASDSDMRPAAVARAAEARHRANTVLRHWEQLKVYAAMLGVDLTETQDDD